MIRWIAGLLLAAVVSAAPQNDPVETRLYDTSFFTSSFEDRPGTGFNLYQDAIGTTISAGEERRSRLPDLTGIIRIGVAPGSWFGPPGKLEATPEGLRITNRKSVHDQLGPFLARLRATLDRFVTIDAAIVDADPAFLIELRKGSAPDRPSALTADAARRLLDAARKGDRASLVKHGRFTAFPGQRVHLQEVFQQTYLADHDVQIAAAAVALDPIVDVLYTGAGFDVRPNVGPNGRTVTLRFRGDVSKLLSIEERKLTIAKFVPPGPGPGAAGEGVGPATHPVAMEVPVEATVQLPRADHDSVRTDVTGRSGETLIAAAVLRGRRTRIFLVTPTVTASTPAPPAPEGRHVRLFDLSAIVRPVQDFAGPQVALVSPTAGGGPLTGATFTLDEPFHPASLDLIVERIKRDAAPDSWRDGTNLIDDVGINGLAIRQTPAGMKAVDRVIGEILREQTRTITTEIFIVSFARETRAPAGPFIDAGRFEKLLQSAIEGKTAKLLGAAEVTGLPDQRVFVVHHLAERYVQDYEPQVSSFTGMFDPIMGVLLSGTTVDVRPRLDGGEDRVLVGIRTALTERKNWEVRQVSTALAPVQVPALTGHRWETDVLCMPGKVTVAALETKGEGDEAREIALFVRARVNRLK